MGLVVKNTGNHASDDLTCAGDVLSRLDLAVVANGQAQDLGLVVLDERQGCLDTLVGGHFDSVCGLKAKEM